MTLLELINRTSDYFQKRGLESPKLQIELLLAHVLKISRMQLYLQFERVLLDSETEALRPLVKRRAEREPLQYITGLTSFDALSLECSPAALIPRPETELLIDLIKKDLQGKPTATLADVGTGTGAIALSLAKHFPEWRVLAIDISPPALELFERNRIRHSDISNVTAITSNLLSSVNEPIHVVVANLPYLTTEEMQNLQAEVRFEPSTALDGGRDGLDLIRQLIQNLPATVERIYLELGIAQAEAVSQLLHEAGFTQVTVQQDFLERDRFVFASKVAG